MIGAAPWIPVAGEMGDFTPPPPPPPPPGSFDPFTINGVGNDVISLSVPGDVAAIVDFQHDGSSNFLVWSLDAGLDTIDLLVNEIGSYEGRRGLNTGWFEFSGLEPVRYLDVTADGTWSLTVSPTSHARSMSGRLSGHGDEVVRYDAGSPATMTSTHNGSSNFVFLGDSPQLEH